MNLLLNINGNKKIKHEHSVACRVLSSGCSMCNNTQWVSSPVVGPWKWKTIIRSENRRVPCHWVFSEPREPEFVVRNSEGKVSVGLRRAAWYIMQCNRWDAKHQTARSLNVETCIVQSLDLLHSVLASMSGLVLWVAWEALHQHLLLLCGLSLKSNNSFWTMTQVERTFCQTSICLNFLML